MSFLWGTTTTLANSAEKSITRAWSAPQGLRFFTDPSLDDLVNEEMGRTICFDGRAQNASYWPIPLVRMGATTPTQVCPVMSVMKLGWETVSKEEGNPIEVEVDVASLLEEAKAKRKVITKVDVEGEFKIGKQVKITWEADPSVETISISRQTVAGYYYSEEPYALVHVAPHLRFGWPRISMLNWGTSLGRFPRPTMARETKRKKPKIPLATPAADWWWKLGKGNNTSGLYGTPSLRSQTPRKV